MAPDPPWSKRGMSDHRCYRTYRNTTGSGVSLRPMTLSLTLLRLRVTIHMLLVLKRPVLFLEVPSCLTFTSLMSDL